MLIVGMRVGRSGHGDRRSPAVLGLLALSFLMALGPLRQDLLPNPAFADRVPRYWVEIAVLAMAAGLAAVLAGFRRHGWPRGIGLLKCVWIGVGLFAAPALAQRVPEPVPELTAVALLALVTVFAVVLEPYLGAIEALTSGRDLPAAVACVGGIFLVFPVVTPRNSSDALGLFAMVVAAACVAAANCAGVALLHRPASEGTPRLAVLPLMAVASGGGALALALLTMLHGSAPQQLLHASEFLPALFWPALVDVPAIFLLFWLMQKMTAGQMALRFVMGPLMAVMIEALALQQRLTAQTFAGLGIAIAGAWWMLRSRAHSPDLRGGLLSVDKPWDGH